MSNNIPFIPDNAPFSAEQRAWLNGFLASLFSTVAAPASTAAGKRIAVLYASQSGTAEGLARKLAKELKAQGHTPAISTLVGYSPAALAAESHALILASTYGDGNAPDGVQPFYEQLCLEHFPRMEKLRYSVFALGDKHYEHFCKFGVDLDVKLAALGANPICMRVDSDVDVEQPFTEWKAAVFAHLNKNEPKTHMAEAATSIPTSVLPSESKIAGSATPMQSTKPKFSRENPLQARLLERRRLTAQASTKVTLHLAFSTENGRLTYEAGDAFGVVPTNDPNLVAEILQQLHFNGNEQVPDGSSATTTLHNALLHNVQITRLTRRIVQEYGKRGNCVSLLALSAPEMQQELERYISERGLIDLLVEFPGVVYDPVDLVRMLPRLTPRL